ncbi:unnamed protein product [Durusdinium trenchii]|uniref:Uncharacterized protein n=1 Tax=Durusdinium trenchii TaxID=1381693 RepID=A0ABP0PCK2_9DINO
MWESIGFLSVTVAEAIRVLQQHKACERHETWSRRECAAALRMVRIDMINTVREEMRDQVTVVIRSLQDLMVMSSLVLVVGFGSVCEGTFPDTEAETEYPGLQNFFLELYASLAALTLVMSLGSLLLAMVLSMELECFLSACTADLQRHVRRALKRDWPVHRHEDLKLDEMLDKDALQAVLEDARAVHGLATGLLQQVRYFERLYPLAHVLLFSSMLSAVFELTVLLSLILVHHFPSMPVLWKTYCGTVLLGVSMASTVSLWTIWKITSPREELEEVEDVSAALSPVKRRSSRRFQDLSARFNTSQRLEELQEPLLDSLASWEDRIWVAILTSGCVFLAFTVLGKFQEPNCKKYPQLCADTSGYVVVLDAGSTGTRVHVFNYEYRKLEPRRFPLIVSPPLTLPTEIAAATNKPGLSSFVHQTEGIPRKLDELIRHAADALLLHNPDVQLKQVPLYLGATAGLRELHNRDRDEVMKAAREYLRKQEVFAVTRDEQVRVLSGEEEGAFGWLALNQLQAEISPDSDTTLGALDFGGASMQIAFVPQETSILAGLFPMHFGGSVKGPIHLYSHSFTGYGSVVAFQRATRVLLESHRKRKTEEEVKHPCMPTGLTWNVNHDEFGVSINKTDPEREKGPLKLVGTGDFDGCYALTAPLFDKETPCFLPPCSMMGVYQPRLNGTRFVLFGEYARFKQWEVLPLVQKGLPLMKALEVQLPRLCSLPLRTQVELFGGSSMRHGPDCWMATWIFAMLKDGLGFSVHGYPQVDVVPSCCDHTLGHATYEVNFFPYSVSRSSYMSLAAKQLHLDELGSVDLREWCPGLSAVQAILFAAAGACLLLLLQSTRKRVWPASKAEPLLQAV